MPTAPRGLHNWARGNLYATGIIKIICIWCTKCRTAANLAIIQIVVFVIVKGSRASFIHSSTESQSNAGTPGRNGTVAVYRKLAGDDIMEIARVKILMSGNPEIFIGTLPFGAVSKHIPSEMKAPKPVLACA